MAKEIISKLKKLKEKDKIEINNKKYAAFKFSSDVNVKDDNAIEEYQEIHLTKVGEKRKGAFLKEYLLKYTDKEVKFFEVIKTPITKVLPKNFPFKNRGFGWNSYKEIKIKSIK